MSDQKDDAAGNDLPEVVGTRENDDILPALTAGYEAARDNFKRQVVALNAVVSVVADRWRQVGPIVQRAMSDAAAYVNRPSLVEEAGWLPHRSTPLDLIDSDALNAAEVDDVLNRYYETRWLDVRADFESSVASLDLDDEAKATFTEALDAVVSLKVV